MTEIERAGVYFLIDRFWAFDENQQPISNWHDKQEVLEKVRQLSVTRNDEDASDERDNIIEQCAKKAEGFYRQGGGGVNGGNFPRRIAAAIRKLKQAAQKETV